jgi:nucleoside 2-deoxyribosyltransferase
MTSYYLAARYARRPALARHAKELAGLGHSVTSRWLNPKLQDVSTLAGRAQMDLDDIIAADEVIVFTEAIRCRKRPSNGGFATELGFALALEKPITLIGVRPDVFHWLPVLRHYHSWPSFLEALQKASRLTQDVTESIG